MEHIELAELQANKQAVEQQLAGYKADLEQIKAAPFVDENQVKGIEAEIETAEGKIEKVNAEIERLEAVGLKVQNEVVESFDSLTVPGSDDTIPLAYLLTTDLIPLEDKMAIITSFVQNKLANAAIVKASLEAENDRLQVRNEALETDNTYLTKRNDELDLKAGDLESKLHNAGVQIEELKAEDNRKESEISKLRDQLSKSAQPTNAKVESVESMAEGLAKRPAIYNVRWESELGRTHKLANLAETGEEVRFHYFNEGIYRVLNDEELLQFRKEKEVREHQAAVEAAKLAEEAIQNQPLVVPPFFEAPSEGTGHQLDETNKGVEVAERPVSRAEFENLKQEVAQLKQTYKVAV